MVKKENIKKHSSTIMLLLNLFVLPGLGSYLNETKNGKTIFIGGLISIPLMMFVIGFLTLPVFWIWGIIDAITNMQTA